MPENKPIFRGGPSEGKFTGGDIGKTLPGMGASEEGAEPSLQGVLELLQKATGMVEGLKAKEAGPTEGAPVEDRPIGLRPPMMPR